MKRITAFIVLWLWMCLFFVTNSLSSKAKVGQFFSYPISLQQQSVVASGPLILETFQSSGASLPAWLSLWQRDDSDSAYLYGTPDMENGGKLNIQIVGIDTKSYQTVKEDLVIELNENPVKLLYFLELPIVNVTMSDLLSGDSLFALTTIVRRLWTRGEVVLITVTPTSPNIGTGVTLKFGGSKHFSVQLRLLSTHPSSEACQTTGDPKVAVEKDFAPRFQVDWCRVMLTDLSRNPPTEGPNMDGSAAFVWRSVAFSPPALVTGRAHSLYVDFLACVLIPLAVLLLLLLVLACVMCCGRTGWEKRVRMTPEPQLVRYNSIRRASISLRQLSENRELQLSASSMNVGPDKNPGPEGKAEPRSAPGTLQRKRDGSPAPPPYRPPMAYSTGTQ